MFKAIQRKIYKFRAYYYIFLAKAFVWEYEKLIGFWDGLAYYLLGYASKCVQWSLEYAVKLMDI